MEPLFKTDEEAEEFAEEVAHAFTHVLMISAAGGISTGNTRKAVLFGDLLARMHYYKMEKARELALAGKPNLAVLDADVDVVWPKLQERLDKNLADVALAMREAKGEEVH